MLYPCSDLHTQLILALEWKDPARDYLDVLAETFEHPSYLELENNAQVIMCNGRRRQCGLPSVSFSHRIRKYARGCVHWLHVVLSRRRPY